jgi:hypothetical protein
MRRKGLYFTVRQHFIQHKPLCIKFKLRHESKHSVEIHITILKGATRYGLDGPGIGFWWGQDCPHPSRPALGPTQPPIQ